MSKETKVLKDLLYTVRCNNILWGACYEKLM